MIRHRITVSALALVLAIGAVPARAQIFGPSDEEKAHEANQDSQLNQLTGETQQLDSRLQTLEDKVHSLTDSLSRATGTNEELRHQIDLLNDKIDHEEKDFAYRLCMLSAQQLGAGADQGGLNCANGGSGGSSGGGSSGGGSSGGGSGSYAPAPPLQSSGPSSYAAPSYGAPRALQPGNSLPPLSNGPASNGLGGDDSDANPAGPSDAAPVTRGRPPGNLGTLPVTGSNSGGFSPPPRGSLNGGGGTAQYDTAMNLLSKAQYSEASAAFRAYADSHPEDTNLAPQAVYWIGDIAYVQQDYQNAARSFAEVIKKYPKAPAASDSMLKLGQSFAAMGQKSDACTTFGLLKSKFPNAKPGTLQAASDARKAANCSR